MKNIKFLAVFFLLLTIVTACDDDDDEKVMSFITPELTSYDAEVNGGSFSMSVKSNIEWTARADKGWLVVSKEGEGETGSMTAVIDENTTGSERNATIFIESFDASIIAKILVKQAAGEVVNENYHYKIPVVFQVIYYDESDKTQNIPAEELEKVLEGVNQRWKNSGQDLNMEFVMATVDPDGKRMAEPGVNRTKWNMLAIDHNSFMGYTKDSPSRYKELMWDQKKYVNICLYRFADKDVSGIACMPHTTAPDSLIGLEKIQPGAEYTDLVRPHCVSINNINFKNRKTDGRMRAEFVGTISHELGHYFGLRHPFGENARGNNENADTDYCEDTPTYNRYKYVNSVNSYFRKNPDMTDDQLPEDQLLIFLTRKISNVKDGGEFKSTNIMDYYYTLKNTFTANQAERIRYVLLHSPFIPGPKLSQPDSKAVGEVHAPVNVSWIECK